MSSKEAESEDDDMSDDELEIIARNLEKLMRRKENSKGLSSFKYFRRDQTKVICHNCKEPAHYKASYPQKKKVLMSSWKIQMKKRMKSHIKRLMYASWPIPSKIMR
ncbi:hypothetical protein PIB30_054008 [Stylosanthes scabra]|uniref:Uncharacterized protein n=1 Tax=Stylosanthes scabra TaxID=79078 RepID=A0ABU6VH44_9FABA|nr:hypothetical protein [Stylosanthes scabra]